MKEKREFFAEQWESSHVDMSKNDFINMLTVERREHQTGEDLLSGDGESWFRFDMYIKPSLASKKRGELECMFPVKELNAMDFVPTNKLGLLSGDKFDMTKDESLKNKRKDSFEAQENELEAGHMGAHNTNDELKGKERDEGYKVLNAMADVMVAKYVTQDENTSRYREEIQKAASKHIDFIVNDRNVDITERGMTHDFEDINNSPLPSSSAFNPMNALDWNDYVYTEDSELMDMGLSQPKLDSLREEYEGKDFYVDKEHRVGVLKDEQGYVRMDFKFTKPRTDIADPEEIAEEDEDDEEIEDTKTPEGKKGNKRRVRKKMGMDKRDFTTIGFQKATKEDLYRVGIDNESQVFIESKYGRGDFYLHNDFMKGLYETKKGKLINFQLPNRKDLSNDLKEDLTDIEANEMVSQYKKRESEEPLLDKREALKTAYDNVKPTNDLTEGSLLKKVDGLGDAHTGDKK